MNQFTPLCIENFIGITEIHIRDIKFDHDIFFCLFY